MKEIERPMTGRMDMEKPTLDEGVGTTVADTIGPKGASIITCALEFEESQSSR